MEHNTMTVKFNELWNDFLDSFKGRLITEASKQDFEFSIIRFILSEIKQNWLSEYTINGRWLNKLIQEFPEKGKLVKEILIKDITIEEVNVDVANLDFLKYVSPIVAGTAGYGISEYLELSTIGTTCATLVPMAIVYPIMRTYLRGRTEKVQALLIDSYIKQLDKYKESVISVLLAE